MAIIIETCPKCGHDLINEIICTYPPIPRKSCPNCGWHWEGEPEKVVRVPFGGNSFNEDKPSYLNKRSYLNCIVDDIDIDEITQKEIQEYLSTTINTMITNHASKYMY